MCGRIRKNENKHAFMLTGKASHIECMQPITHLNVIVYNLTDNDGCGITCIALRVETHQSGSSCP